MDTDTVTRSLDRRDTTITVLVVFDADTELEKMREGEILELLTDDYEPFERDIEAWCEATGHRLLSGEAERRGRRFLIEKGASRPISESLAMVISADGLEELLSPLGFALAAALEGMEVHLFFQGPAVRVLEQGFRPKLRGWARPFSRIAARGMARMGHLPPQEKLRQLRHLGARFYVCGPSARHFKVDTSRLVFDDLPLVEYLTFMAVMERAAIQIYS